MGRVEQLPCELFSRIMQQLQWSDIIRASQVCHNWRITTFNDPIFWKDVRIDSVDDNALYWADLRLIYGRDLPFRLKLDLPDVQVAEKLLKTLFQMLSGSLYRLQNLDITMEEIFTIRLWEALISFPAPRLESFCVRLTATPYPALNRLLALPPDVFSNEAPRLQEVLICDVILPSTPIPAFRHAKRVGLLYHAYTTQPFPAHVFRYFENMNHLRLAGNLVIFPVSLDSHTLSGINRLQWLDIDFRNEVQLSFLQRLPTQSLDTIVVSFPDEDTVYAAMEGLLSPFHMSITCEHFADSDEFNLDIRSGNGKLRRFVERLSNYDSENITSSNALFDNVGFHCQIDGLRISSSMWAIACRILHPLPNLQTLTLDIEDVDPATRFVSVPKGAFKFVLPCLKVLTMEARDTPAFIASRDVEVFTRSLSEDHSVKFQHHGILMTLMDGE